MNEIDILKKQLAREKLARKEAESILEKKSSELYEVNHNLKVVANNLSLQHAISSVLANTASQNAAIQKVLQVMCKMLDMQIGELWEIGQNDTRLGLSEAYCLDKSVLKKFIEKSKLFSFGTGVGLPGKVLESHSIHQIWDVTQDPNFPRATCASEAGLHSAFAFPLFVDNKVIGVIVFLTDQLKAFDSVLLSVIQNIGNQVGIFLEREYARKNMLETQRIAGISEVTTSMLHNIGNILNSVNVSLSLLEENCKNSKLNNLLLLRDLIKSHEHDFINFISNDEQGMQLPTYLIALGDYWQNQHKNTQQEFSSLLQNINHITDILKSQQFLAGSFGMVESIQVCNLLNDAVNINSFTLNNSDVIIQKEYEDIPPILVDRIKFLQILVNIVRNALQAIASNKVDKKIILRIKTDKKMVTIQVIDNGCGIEKKNLIKIFSHGYTTKLNGHGFGLHASALSAHEMGGSLTAESEGLNNGATFTLTLPYKLPGKIESSV